MTTIRTALVSLTVGMLFGCGGQLHRLAYPPPEGPAPGLRRHAPRTDPAELSTAAFAHYGRGDHVRALRCAYRAAQAAPHDVGLPLLLGLIYDRGLDRPDLAVLEYRRALDRHPRGTLSGRLQRRIHILRRRDQIRRAGRALQPGATPPLSTDRLAAFPLQPIGPRRPPTGLRLGLIDLLLYGLQSLSDTVQVDPLQLHILSRTFQDAHPDAPPEEFAHWVGAGRTLTGTLSDLGDRRIRIVLRILGPDGAPLYEAPPVTGDMRGIREIYHALLRNALAGLDIPQPEALPPPPVASPLSLLLHTEGLIEYLSGRTLSAHRRLSDARLLDPESGLISRTYGWVTLDLAGEREVRSLSTAYRNLMTQPDPSEAIQRRLQETHTLIVPPPGEYTGEEGLNPYKPPPAEVIP